MGRQLRRLRGAGASKEREPERQRHAAKKPKQMEELLLAADPTVAKSLRRVDFE